MIERRIGPAVIDLRPGAVGVEELQGSVEIGFASFRELGLSGRSGQVTAEKQQET